eukprot:3327239-Alexandrium_andersonii.AAC.1
MSWTVRATTTTRGFGNWPERTRARAQRQPVTNSPKKRKPCFSVTYGPSTARMTSGSESSHGRSSRISYGSFQTGASRESRPCVTRRTAPSLEVQSQRRRAIFGGTLPGSAT